MRGRLLVIILFLVVLSCSEEDLPDGIYHYQVERLLTGQTGTKTWSQVMNVSNCADSVKLNFTLVANTLGDSVDVSRITGCAATADTSLIGRANASNAGVIFTDSLIFANGNFWIVDQISSQRLSLISGDQNLQYQTLQ